MKYPKLIIIAIMAVIVFLVGGVALKLFLFGEIKDISSIVVQDLLVTSEKISFSPLFTTSADTIGRYSYRIEGDILYIKTQSVLVGGMSKQQIEINGDFSTVQKIVLEDNKNTKIIWER